MPHYYVKVMVEFSGEIHAESRAEAEDYAYSNWGANAGDQISYDGVYSTKAEDIDATDYLDNCPDECSDVTEYEEENADEEEVA
jgi:hypothetical protein